MAKTIDITDKLNFESKPQITVRNVTVEVNNEAVTVLEIMPLFEKDTSTAEGLSKACKLLFSEKDYEKIKQLKLNFADFTVFIRTAIELAAGNSEGEAQTRATT